MSALVLANLMARRARTALTALGVAVGVTTVVALLAVTGGLTRSAGDLGRLGQADFGVFQAGLADLTASSLPSSVASRIRGVRGVAAAAPIQIVPNALARDSSLLVFGSEPNSFLTRRLVLTAGRAPRGAQALVGVNAASRLHVSPGQLLTISGHRLAVAGTYRSGIALEDAGVVLPLSLTRALSRRPGEVSMVAVSVAPGYSNVTVEDAVDQAVPGTVAVSDPGEVSRVDTNSRVINKAAVIIAVLALLLGAVVVTNTMAMAVIERRRQFGLLAIVGWSRGRIARLILAEATAVSLAGALVGLALGAAASALVVRALAAGAFVSAEISLWVLVRGLLVGLALGVLGALACLWRVLRTAPLQAIG